MSGDESVAEQVFEAGLEIVNPGGDPDTLRSAAKGWRDLHDNLQSMFQALDRDVQRTLDSGWRGPAADSFAEHWKNLNAGMDKSLPQLPQAAKGLDDAADAIEEINSEIHEIYLEIGISIGVSVGMSFLTMGFSAAAGAARAAQLATKAAKLAKTLGTLLRKVSQLFKWLSRMGKEHRFLKNVLVNWASNTGGTVITNALTGQKTDVGDAVWQGGLASLVGTGPGLGAARGMAALGRMAGEAEGTAAKAFSRFAGSGWTQDVVGGGVGSIAGGLAVDGVKKANGEDVEFGWDAAVNGVTGGAGGAAVHGVNTQVPSGRGPHFPIEGIAQGVSYGVGGAIAKPVHDAIWPPDEKPDDAKGKAADTPQGPKKGSVKDVFG
ncbi:WXG100 family type VII secretion target [Streptomyces inhibens]|uniref:WXG100 family type VII secretion target n=1 Tax=Streptomyces inhibens TaxID=2293571 RepID=UPI001EE69C13|nr:WXG100 family type VII secretion target [Streptomyces inhibens]UKY47789.1 WXG100 family type VII secretion target [Streptomyces inhibens]